MPPTIKISRIGEVRVKNAYGQPWPIVGHVRPFEKRWTAHDRDGGLLHDDSKAPLVFDGQREAARAICQMQGLWPEETS
jgi:hypothetical protein